MGIFNIWNTSGANKASLTFTGNSDKTVDTNTVLQSTDSTASIANGKVVVDSSGNVGIGVTPSTWGGGLIGLQVGQNQAIVGYKNVLSAGTLFVNNAYYNGTNWIYTKSDKASSFNAGDDIAGGFVWKTSSSGTAGNAITWSEAMRLDASGNIKLTNGIIQNNSGRAMVNQTGGILQIVTNSSNTFYNNTSGGSELTLTNFATSITPTNSSTKILIHLDFSSYLQGNLAGWKLKVYRNGTAIYNPANSYEVYQNNPTAPMGDTYARQCWTIPDFPATTGTVTYTFSIVSYASVAGAGVNYGGFYTSFITLFEVAQ